MFGVAAVVVGFPGPNTAGIVLVIVGHAANRYACQLPAVLPGHGVAAAVVVAQRITNRIVGNRLAVKGSQQVQPIRIPISVSVGSCDCAAAVLLVPGNQVAAGVVGVLVAVFHRSACQILRCVGQLSLRIVGIVPAGAVHLVGHLGDVAAIIIGILEPNELGGAAPCGGVERLRAHGGGARSAARLIGPVLGQSKSNIALVQPGKGVIAVVNPTVVEQRHAGQIAIGNGIRGVGVVIEAFGCTVDNAGNGIGKALQPILGVIQVLGAVGYGAAGGLDLRHCKAY